MAHIGKKRRFELVGLQGTVTCGNQGLFRILVTLDALAYSQYHVWGINRQSVISGTAELPPFIVPIRTLQPETHP